ncbi:hypothetical protein [Streptomyces sp. NPDC052015]|uniref:hypothetical protein n=1 Tax=Streptomyces sp. NPDC052015 TaxID=3154755 RepID=UPI00343864D5
MADVVCADVSRMDADEELCRFDLHLCGGERIQIGGQWGIRQIGPWYDLWRAIQLAVGIRELYVLRSTVGLGPWGEDEWARVEALVPEITAFDTYAYQPPSPPSQTKRVQISHREGISTLLHRLADRKRPFALTSGDIIRKGWDILDTGAERDEKIRRRCDAWAALIERLQDGTEVTSSPQWTSQVDAIFRSALIGPDPGPLGVEWRLDTPP